MLVVSGQKFERRITLTPSGAKIICFTHQSGGLDLYYTFFHWLISQQMGESKCEKKPFSRAGKAMGV